MSKEKKKVRELFRTSVFERDGHKCRVCEKIPQPWDAVGLDAHHITPREVMPSGGYVKENGISLCCKCHILAETRLETNEPKGFELGNLEEYGPENLYKLINSSYEKAYQASQKL